MKFKNYLNEENNIDGIISSIKSDCIPFLKYFKNNYKNNNYFISGRGNLKVNFKKKSIRKDRNPRDTKKWAHDLFNEYFKKKFGKNLRSESLFCQLLSYDKIVRREGFQYGNTYFVFPISDFHIYYNKNIDDLYLEIKEWSEFNIKIKDEYRIWINPELYPKEVELIENQIKKIVSDYVIWKGEKNSWDKHKEYMVHCDQVYLVSYEWLKENNKLDYFLSELHKD